MGSLISATEPPRAAPALADVLGTLLPDPVETLLLRACLLSGEPAHDAWRSWCAQVGDRLGAIQTHPVALKGLLPLIHTAIQRNGLTSDQSLLTTTRVAYLREELRSKAYREICGRVLSDMAAEDIPVIALRACAMAETVYPTPASRHCEAIDLLVREEDRERAAPVLAEPEWAPVGSRRASGMDSMCYEHSSGLPLELHVRPFEIAHGSVPLDAVWAASRVATIAGADTRILSPADSLLDVCGHAAGTQARINLHWVCDAWFRIDRHHDLDWRLFLDRAKGCGLALPLFVIVRYLSEELDAAVPEEVVTALRQAAAKASRADREVALLAMLTGLSALRRTLFREARSWGVRATVLRFVLAPSPGWMRRQFGVRGPLLLPLIYLYRPCRYVLSRIGRRFFPGPARRRETARENARAASGGHVYAAGSGKDEAAQAIPTDRRRRVTGAIATPADIAAAIGELDRSYAEAAERRPGACESMNYLVAGFPLRLDVVGNQLARDIDKALCHLRAPQDAAPAFTVEVWDESECGSGDKGARVRGWDLPDHIVASADARHVIHYHRSSVMRLDRRASRVVGCVRGPDALFLDERARPFHRQLSLMLNDRNIQFIHAGLVDHAGKGLLFVGKGGSGKTTASIAGFLDGFGYLGDDFVGLEMTGEGRLVGHALYATCLIERNHFSRFPELAAIGRPPNHPEEDKLLVYLTECEAGRFAQQTRLNAVVMPRVVDAAETSYRRARPMDAMLSLAPSSVIMLPGAAPRSLEKFRSLVTTTPAFWFDVGRNVGGIGPAVRRLFGELSD